MNNGPDRVNAVLDLLGGNAVLLPIRPGVKKPELQGWSSFGEKEMSDPTYLARFNNGCNIGVALGTQSGGLCTIDIDDDQYIELFLQSNPVLRGTLRTKRLKGCNLWMWVTGEYPGVSPFHHARLKNTKGGALSLGEWRSTGGQTVIQGQADGIHYSVLVQEKPVKIAFTDIVWPEWVGDPPHVEIIPEKSEPSGKTLLMEKLTVLRRSDSGYIWAACPACREDGEDAAGNHLLITPEGKFGCAKYPKHKEHRKRIWAIAGPPKVERDESDPFYQNAEQKVQLPPIVDSAIFLAKEIRPSPEIVKGLLHKGAKMVIGGGSKSFKTWVQLDLAVCIAYGLDWLGFKTLPGKVLFVNFEIQEEFFQQRIRKIAEARNITLEEGRLDVWNLRGKSASYHLIIPQILERIKDSNYVLCILDPVYKLYGKTDENSASDVAQLLNAFEGLCVDTGSAVGFGAHYSKGNQAAKESIDRVSGSGVFARDPDSIIMFTKHEEKDAFTVEPVLRNLPPVESFVVRWQFPLMVRDDDLDPELLKQPGGGKKKQHDPLLLLSFIRDRLQNNPISISEWADKAGIKRQTLSDYLPAMRSKGWIQTVGMGTSARQSITPNGIHALQSV